jgi:catechol 2,3-dioxygenase-like lactoylglutathione lyase family enzyme
MSALIPRTRLTHGTIETKDGARARRFYCDVLGLGSVRPLPEAQYLYNGGPWSVVCVSTGEAAPVNVVENRFCLRVETAAEVDAAHATALAARDEHGIAEIGDVREENGIRSFVLRDGDGTWWEVSNVQAAAYDEAFLRGDVSG